MVTAQRWKHVHIGQYVKREDGLDRLTEPLDNVIDLKEKVVPYRSSTLLVLTFFAKTDPHHVVAAIVEEYRANPEYGRVAQALVESIQENERENVREYLLSQDFPGPVAFAHGPIIDESTYQRKS